jgi:hypothetical protein
LLKFMNSKDTKKEVGCRGEIELADIFGVEKA